MRDRKTGLPDSQEGEQNQSKERENCNKCIFHEKLINFNMWLKQIYNHLQDSKYIKVYSRWKT